MAEIARLQSEANPMPGPPKTRRSLKAVALAMVSIRRMQNMALHWRQVRFNRAITTFPRRKSPSAIETRPIQSDDSAIFTFLD